MSNKMTQKEAVFTAVTNVVGTIDGTYNPTREQRHQINAILFEGFKAGKIDLDREYNDTELKSYVSGLQSNWLRKDKRLNGGVAHMTKNPGSRKGSGDAQIKALKALLDTVVTDEEKSEIQGYIDARYAELTPVKEVTIDYSMLPAALKEKFAK
jgi:hypothetical protein